MVIAKENIGDVLCLYQKGEYIRISDVTPASVSYVTEAGDHYTTRDLRLDALPEYDPDRIAQFETNAMLGNVLYNAEMSARRRLIAHEEPGQASRVLDIVRSEQENLSDRLSRRRPDRALASSFIEELHERGTGSRDQFFGHRVENVSRYMSRFSIDGKTFECDAAKEVLCAPGMVRTNTKTGLDALIQNADGRRANKPSQDQERANRIR